MVNFSDQEAREIEQALILTRAEIEKLNRDLAEKDALIKRLKETTWNENVRLLAESKENLLQQFCNLQILYGAQKHQIRDRDKEIASLRQKVQELMEQAIEWAKEWQNPTGYPSQTAAYRFLQSDEVKAFLKEREGT